MLPTTTLLLLAGAAAIVSSLPISENLSKRYCLPALLPSSIFQLHQNNPTTSYPNTAHTNDTVYISQGANGINKVNELITFVVPANSWSCQLGITFPSNYIFLNSTGPAQQLNVFTVPTPLPSNPTYDNIQKGSLFGTVTPQAGKSVTINSEACPTTAAFVLTYADWETQAASIGWDEYINTMNGQGLRGVHMSYNC